MMNVTLMTAIEKLSSAELQRVKHACAVGDAESMMKIIRAQGYDGNDSPKAIGELIKRKLG